MGSSADTKPNMTYTPRPPRVGGKARIHGLQAKPQYNGRIGVVCSFDAQYQRWKLRVDGDELLIKAANLTAVPA